MTPLRILIVEDEALVARDLQATLARLGYDVSHTARTGAEALHSAMEYRPNLVLMDIRLADGSDGVETARLLRKKYQVPVVYLTAYADDQTIIRARDTQPYGYLLKPFHESELRTVVELALMRHEENTRLAANESLFANTLRSMAEGVISTDLMGLINFMNPVAEMLTGWPQDEARGKSLHEVFRISSPSGQAVEPLNLQPAPDTNGARSIVLTNRSGAQELIEDNTAPIRDNEGGLAGIVVLFRKKGIPGGAADMALLEAQQSGAPFSNLDGIVHSIVDPLVALDANWKMTYLNPQAASVLDGPREGMLGREIWECLPPSIHRLYYHEFSQALARGKARAFEMEIEATQRWFEVQLYPFGNGLLALLRDITSRKATEERERKLEKLESLGLLARGFAHDFNNLLTVLLGNISLAEMQTASEAPGYAELVTAKQATIQAQGLVQHLLTFARGGVPVKQPTDLGRLVNEWALEWTKKDGISYHMEVSPELMQADVDRKQIARLLHNLVRNAEQSIRQSGNVTIRLIPGVKADAATIASGAAADSNGENWLLLQVSDDGFGIREEDQVRIYEPYFTTRDDANASGLGLTVVESIAKAHGAAISLQSKLDHGTTFSVWFPEFNPPTMEFTPARVEPAVEKPIPASSETARILILEDEPLIRQLMAATLKSMNCTVDQTSDGADTIARYSDAMDRGEPYQLLIMDLSIPNGMGGLQAMDQILTLDPTARAIVSSGYCDDPVLSRYMDYGFRAVLPKPYQPQELKSMVELMLKE